ncbi:MAG: thioredoxin [Tannerellaceae bacterium]|jgi:thioredoxin 1|nr:thioredoxin [Tannerellaceae bacterium]
MSILKKSFVFIALNMAGILFLQAHESENKSKYIHPLIVSDSVFQSAILSQEYVMVDFWAVWCRPCQLFSPEYEQIAKRFHKQVAFYKLDTDKCPATVKKYDAKMIPTIIIFKNGKEIKRYVGLTAKERIIFDLEEIIHAE